MLVVREAREARRHAARARVAAHAPARDHPRPSPCVLRSARQWLGRLGEFDSTCAERDGARAELERLRKARHEEFMGGFLTISAYLKEMYQMITLGGDAELELVDSLDPFSEVRLRAGPGRAGRVRA